MTASRIVAAAGIGLGNYAGDGLALPGRPAAVRAREDDRRDRQIKTVLDRHADRRQTGALAENSAAAFLESQGFVIVARNFLRRVGEIDVVARAGELLVVAEVRTRASDRFGGAAASVSRDKQRRIAATTALFLQCRPELSQCRVRFDVLVVRDGAIEWLKHAFDG